MKALRLLLPLVVAGVVVLAGVALLSRRSDAAAYRLGLEELRRELVERSVVARGLAGPAGAGEAGALLRWWFERLDALRSRHPGSRGSPRPLEGSPGAAEWRRFAENRLAALRAGYQPVASGVDQGVRLDLLSITPGEHPDTHERMLRIDFALWGAPRKLERDGEGAAGRGERQALRVVVPAGFRQLAFRFASAAGKAYGEMTGSGEPYRILKDPERFAEELPVGVALGTWWVEPFPREAAKVEVAVGVQVQGTSAASLSPSFGFELAVPEAWQLRPGEAFKAETRELPPEPPPGKRP